MDDFKFSCPQCKQHLQFDEQFSEREIQCPTYQVLIRIPPVPGKTAQFKPESGKSWAPFVPSGNAEPPRGLSVSRKDYPPKRPEK